MDPVGGNNCQNINTLKDMCNKAARRKGLIPANGSLNFLSQPGFYEYPACEEVTFPLDDVAGYWKTHTVYCCSKESMYFSIGRGQSQYGAYEYKCYQAICTAVGNIGYVFA